MATMSYADAVSEALQRLQGVGFEHGPSFANHAPMAAEALARLGYADDVPAWVEQDLRTHRYHQVPEARWRLSATDETDWASALGHFDRVADWSAMFERELAEEPWADVLARWWPRLLPGMSGALTHGMIRTAHAVRAIALATDDDRLQRGELAHGLGYWAARYSGTRWRADVRRDQSPTAVTADGVSEPDAVFALDELIADSAGFYARRQPDFPIPLIHTITAPAAVRLMCEYLPEDQRRPSYVVVRQCSDALRSRFGTSSSTHGGAATVQPEPPAEAELIAAAVELGDEHAIKLAEVAIRQNALAPDDRYSAALHVATRQISRHLV
ncbi:MAG: questin oxidase family protein [Pseudonocardiaceae bacterium]